MANDAVTWNLDLLGLFEQQVSGALSGLAPTDAMERCFSQWAAMYRAWSQERFSTYSRGGGDWPPLAESTIKARYRRLHRAKRNRAVEEYRLKTIEYYAGYRKKMPKYNRWKVDRFWGKTGQIAKMIGAEMKILWDRLGTIFMALDPVRYAESGGADARIPNGIRVGFGGPAMHPDGKTTIAQIAAYHNSGGGHLPQRKLLESPPDSVTAEMAQALQTAMKRIWAEVTRGFRS